MKGFYQYIIEIENSNKKAVLCTVIATKGSTPRKSGSKMIVFENGKIVGTIGGGALEKKVIEVAVSVCKSRKATITKHNLVSELGMCCGGSVEIYLEPIMNKKKVYIFGMGHIGKALSKFAIDLDFNVTLIDDRNDAFENFDVQGCSLINKHHIKAIEELPFDEHTFVVVLTHDHAFDREILALTAKKKHAYLGMVGSERKVEIAKKNLLASNFVTEKELNEINMPIGIEINVKTPEEIAISILAKLIDVRNKLEDSHAT